MSDSYRLHELLTHPPHPSSEVINTMTQQDYVSEWHNVRSVARRRNQWMLFAGLLIMVLPILGFLTLDTNPEEAATAPALSTEQLIGYSLGTTPLQFGTEQLVVQGTEAIHYLTVQRTAPIPLDAAVFLTCEGEQAFVHTDADDTLSPIVALPEVLACPRS